VGAVRPLTESTVLVTGATDGLGKAVAAELAGAGATVLVHGRDDTRAAAAANDLATTACRRTAGANSRS
jgi:NAD(P)-dependent dehydrogenase (short-subunit alcohol dehydrogenase family)